MTVVDLTFDQGFGKFAFEGKSLSQQAALEPSTRRPNGKQARLSVSPTDNFQGAPGTRALFCKYDLNQRESEKWYLIQIQAPSEDGLMWELHHVYAGTDAANNLDLPGTIAPYAVHKNAGKACARTCVGDFAAGQNHNANLAWHPNDVLFSSPSPAQAMDIVLHAVFTETPGAGLAEWFIDPTGQGKIDLSKPAYRYPGIQTLPTYRAGNVTGKPLYLCQGYYRGWAASTTATMTHGGSVCADTFQELAPWLGSKAGPVDSLPLSKTATGVPNVWVLSWVAPPGAVGYTFWRNGLRVSSSYDGTKTTVKITAEPGDRLEVRALLAGPHGTITT